MGAVLGVWGWRVGAGASLWERHARRRVMGLIVSGCAFGCCVAPAAANSPPNARPDSVSTAVDTQATVNVLANDDDPDGDPLSVTNAVLDFGSVGNVSCQSSGSCSYTPPSGFTGTSSFQYTVSDGNGNSANAEVCVLVGAHGENGYVAGDFVTDFYPNACGGLPVGPFGLGFDSSGHLFVVYSGDLYRFGASGGIVSPQTLIGSIAGGPAGLAFGGDGRLYVGRQGSHDVVEVDPATGAVLRTVASIPFANGLAVDPKSGDLFVAFDNGFASPIVRVAAPASANPATSTYAYVANPDGIAFGADGTLYAAADGGVDRISGTSAPDAGTVTHLADIAGGPDGIAVAADKSFLLVNRNDGQITKLDLQTLAQTTVYTGGTRGDFATVGPGGCLYATQTTSIIKVTNADGTCSLAPTLPPPSATGMLEVRLAISPSGDPGRFDLQVDGQTRKAAAGDGDTTGTLVVPAGSHTIGEIGSTNPATSLADYTETTVCKDQHGAGSIVAQSTSSGLRVTVNPNDDIVCTITDTRVPPPNPVLTVAKIGQGTVTSTDGAISCGTSCSHTYAMNTTVVLSAQPDTGWRFGDWSDPACAGTATCTVTLTGDKTVTVTFQQLPPVAPGKIVYSLETSGNTSDIWSVDPDGQNAVNVTKNAKLGARTPSLSPGGTQIAFASLPALGSRDLMVINSDGTALRNLTSSFHSQIGEVWDPTWSPDGKKIAFKGGPYSYLAAETADVYVMNVNGVGGLTQLTHLGDVHDAAWSPVDDRIAFTRRGSGTLYTVNSTGSVKPVFRAPCCATVSEPAWSPDGTQLAFEYTPSAGTFAIARVNAVNGSGLTRLTAAGAPVSQGPSWSPDGTQIVFSRSVSGFSNGDLFIISANSGEGAAGPLPVTHTPSPVTEQEPWWGKAAGSGGAGGAAPTTAQIKSALLSSITPTGKLAKIGTILKTGGTVLTATALTAGRLSVSWYRVTKGATIAGANPKTTLVASGRASFTRAGRGKLKISLTAAGKQLFTHARKLTLTGAGTFRPSKGSIVKATKPFTLKR